LTDLPNSIWVTGANGFIGRHLVRQFLEQGRTIVGFGRTSPDVLPKGISAFVPGGLNTACMEEIIAKYGSPNTVFHFAGGGSVGASIANPLADFDSSVASTALLLDCLRLHAPHAHFVLASSAAVYGAGHDGPISIDTPLSPFSPYGHHKRMAEHLSISSAEAFGLRVTILRMFSIYGPGLRKQLIFDLCSKLAAGESPVRLGGTGIERRDWCHVKDVVNLCLNLLPASQGEAKIFNVGTGRAFSIADVAKVVVDAWGGQRPVSFSGQCRPGDPFSLVADPSSLPPGYKPEVSPEDGLVDTVAQFRMELVPYGR